jgi:hypothetical protein
MVPDDGHRAPVPRWGRPLLKACPSPEVDTAAPNSAGVGEDGPPSGRVTTLTTAPSAQQPSLATLRQELETTRHQVAELEALLAELPAIFERKFQQQLQPVEHQHRLLAEENQHLREQALFVLQGSPEDERPLLPFRGRLGFLSRRLLGGQSQDAVA